MAIALGLMGLVFVLSVVPGRARGEGWFITRLVAATPQQLQKFMHVVLYALLAFIWAWALQGTWSTPVTALAVLLVVVGYGASLEWAQTLVPGRGGNVQDVLRDAVGAAIGVLLATVLL
jgi:VanZ family protein